MNRLEYALAATFLRLLGLILSALPPRRQRVVLATARTSVLEGNLLYLHQAMLARRPDLEYVLLLEPYSYGLLGKLAYFARLARGLYHLRTARLFVVDNAYLPIHVVPHGQRTTVVQVWHAAGALKRFGADMATPLPEPERTFLHRHYDHVVTAAEASRTAWAAAFRTPPERVLPLGTPRTDFFFDAAAMAEARARQQAAYPALAGRRVALYAPTFRGRGQGKRGSAALDAERLRAALSPEWILVLKSHPNLDPSEMPTKGYDLVVDPTVEINELLVLTDVLISDYSSSIFEYALLRRPLILLVGDLHDYEVDPGLYLDYRTEMIGTQVRDTDGVIAAILGGDFDLSRYDSFVERHLGACDGRASLRFVEHFLGDRPA
jgi:CDP-ribitol ribitolphosphotransferase